MKPGVPQLVDFGGDDREQAFDLLREGFPSMPARVWQRGFERLAASPPPGGSGRLGQLLLIDGVPAGLVLEIASERDAGAMPRAIVNLSSWYVRPQARANALWMLKALTRRADVTYTDLSATAGVARMLPVLGFETISHQILCMPLVKLASRASTSARVLDERAALDVLRHDPIHRALVEHRALGCRIVAIETDRGIEPLVWRPKRRLKLLTGVELIFARSVDLLLANIDGLARHLLAHGFLLAEVGASQDAILDCGHLPYFRRRFAKGGYRAGGVDYLYSEFVYFDF